MNISRNVINIITTVIIIIIIINSFNTVFTVGKSLFNLSLILFKFRHIEAKAMKDNSYQTCLGQTKTNQRYLVEKRYWFVIQTCVFPVRSLHQRFVLVLMRTPDIFFMFSYPFTISDYVLNQ